MSIPELSIKRPVFTTVVLLALLLLGMVSYTKMNVDEMPDTSFPFVSVTITYEGAQPEQVDSQVTKKVEEAIGEARGIRHIESISREGEGELNVEFNFGINPSEAAQEIRDKIGGIRGELPDGIKEPVISRFDMNAQPVASVALTSETASVREISIFVEDVLKPRLQKLEGVGQLTVSGLEEREVQLLLDIDKLNAYNLSVTEVAEQLRLANQDIPAGKLENNVREFNVRTSGNIVSVKGYDKVVVGKRHEEPVYFWQIGQVRDAIKDRTTTARYDGKPAVGITIGKQSGGNAVKIATAVKRELKLLEEELPAGIELHLIRDDAQRVEDSISDVWYDLLLGSFFAVLIVFWFLGDWRSTVISSLAIPTSIVATFLFMKLAGFSINSMSLLGMSLSVGLLVDDAIVVIENIIRHRRMGKSSLMAASEGTKEITLAVMAATFTVAAVFLPVGFMSGIDGQMFKEFGLTIAFAVLVSLFVSFTLTPMLAAVYLPVGEPCMPKRLTGLWERWNINFLGIRNWYGRLLTKVLHSYRWQVLGIAMCLFMLSLGIFPFLGSTFMPETDRSQFTIKIQAPANATIAALEEQSLRLTKAVSEFEEVQHVYATTSKRSHELFVQLVPKSERTASQEELISQVRRKLNTIPGVRADFIQSDDKPIAISLTGTSHKKLAEMAEQVQKELTKVPGVRDVASSFKEGMPTLNLELREERAYDLGVSSQAIGNTMQAFLNGIIVGKFSDEDERVDVRLRLVGTDRDRAQMLNHVYVPSDKQINGRNLLLPLSQVAQWQYTTSASDVRRYDRQKEIRITANVEGTSMGEALKGFYENIERIKLPVGYNIGEAGLSSDMDESFNNMAMALAMAIAFIFMVLAAQFESYSEPFAIMFSLPLAIIGALLGLFVSGSELSLVSLIGIMLLMGLVTKNAVLLIDFAKDNMRQGKDCLSALVEAGHVRLCPILMTSLSTICGMLPIALGVGQGAEARAPMAHAIIGGVLTSTILTLVVVPVIYSLLYDFRHKKEV